MGRIGRRLTDRLALPTAALPSPDRSELADAADRLVRTTQARVEEVIHETGAPNLHHFDTRRRGFKPGALNSAFEHIRERGLLDEVENAYFIIIDSDSLLPIGALDAVAGEIERQPPSGIMQMASVPTANFFGAGWYSRFVSFTDAVGAVGKWARSVRRRLRPDLAAGSGVVVAAPLATYIARHAGAPWDETTITEDARLIIGQFGLMDGARLTSRLAPVYLLEAVPASGRFGATYRSFWNQRRRWTIGGYDELFYMARAPSWIRRARFDPGRRRWREREPGLRGRWAAAVRRYHRTARWAWDHFWWGIGSAVIFTHWALVSLAIAEPSRPIFLLGLVALLMLPLVFLWLVGRPLARFVPGGLSLPTRVSLYFLAFPAIWLYVLPTLCTQLMCVLGLRSAELEWRPTRKPRYDVLIPVAWEGRGAARAARLEAGVGAHAP